jgi:hypothetical protein
MSAAPILAASRQITADTAGHTGGDPAPLPAMATLHEIVSGDGGLGLILSGGFQPEKDYAASIDTGLARATDSVIGPHGGKIPRPSGNVLPGPAGTASAATRMVKASAALKAGASGIRDLFGNIGAGEHGE